jgi:MFS family permease
MGGGVEMSVRRDPITILSYLGLGLVGIELNGLGSALPHLQAALQTSRAGVAFYPALYAVGMLVVGAFGHHLVSRIGRSSAFRLAVAALGISAVLIATTPGPILTGAGAALMGLGGAVVLVVVSAVLAERHKEMAAAALAEANAVSSFAAIAAPLVIAATITVGLGWRPGVALIPVIGACALVARRTDMGPEAVEATPPAVARKGSSGVGWRPWMQVVLVVAIEFSMVFWASDYLLSEVGLEAATAALVTSLFFIGMATARGLGGPLSSWLARTRPALLLALAVTAVGFLLFWASPFVGAYLLASSGGLLLTGLGVGHLYPLSLGHLISTASGSTDQASARATLASGVAVGGTPLILGRLASAVSLTWAFALVPLLIVAAAINVGTLRAQRTQAPS